jgi:hypothetical protein
MTAIPDRNPAQRLSSRPERAVEAFAAVPQGDAAGPVARVTEAVRVTEYTPPPVHRGYRIEDSPLYGVSNVLHGRIVTDPYEDAAIRERVARDIRREQRREQLVARLQSPEAWVALAVHLGTTASSIAVGVLVFVLLAVAQGGWPW